MYGLTFLCEDKIFKLDYDDKCTNNHEELANILNISLFDLSNHPNWYYKYGIYYFFKEAIIVKRVLNHLLSEKIAPLYNLKTPHFIFAQDEYCKLGFMSKNFRESNSKYIDFFIDYYSFVFYSANDFFDLLESKCKSSLEYETLSDDIIRFLAFQFYTSLTDMHKNNFLFKETNEGIRLDTLFDFDRAFSSVNKNNYTCSSDLLTLKIPSDNFYKVIERFPKLKDYLLILENIDMDKMLSSIEEENFCIIDDTVKDSYKSQDELKKNLVRSLKL
jgi:hypothetical protein